MSNKISRHVPWAMTGTSPITVGTSGINVFFGGRGIRGFTAESVDGEAPYIGINHLLIGGGLVDLVAVSPFEDAWDAAGFTGVTFDVDSDGVATVYSNPGDFSAKANTLPGDYLIIDSGMYGVQSINRGADTLQLYTHDDFVMNFTDEETTMLRAKFSECSANRFRWFPPNPNGEYNACALMVADRVMEFESAKADIYSVTLFTASTTGTVRIIQNK